MAELTTWRKMIAAAVQLRGESLSDLGSTLTEEEMDRPFDPRFGGYHPFDPEDHRGWAAPFTAWTTTRVYFRAEYDGAVWVGSVPRNPCDEVT